MQEQPHACNQRINDNKYFSTNQNNRDADTDDASATFPTVTATRVLKDSMPPAQGRTPGTRSFKTAPMSATCSDSNEDNVDSGYHCNSGSDDEDQPDPTIYSVPQHDIY